MTRLADIMSTENPLAGTTTLGLQTYDEDLERRRYLRGWCDIDSYRTDDERAVAFACHAHAMREKSRLMPPELQAKVLAEIEGALPIDDPMVAHELRDGMIAFYDRVADRIWLSHGHEFTISRCPACNRILKSPHARQCIWCGADWHNPTS